MVSGREDLRSVLECLQHGHADQRKCGRGGVAHAHRGDGIVGPRDCDGSSPCARGDYAEVSPHASADGQPGARRLPA
jgi:hypothetical protein